MAPERSPGLTCPGYHKTSLEVKQSDGGFIALFPVSNSLSPSPLFHLFPQISLSPYEEEEEEEERSLCEMPRRSQSIVLLAVRLN